jgi:hypothetical protein
VSRKYRIDPKGHVYHAMKPLTKPTLAKSYIMEDRVWHYYNPVWEAYVSLCGKSTREVYRKTGNKAVRVCKKCQATRQRNADERGKKP